MGVELPDPASRRRPFALVHEVAPGRDDAGGVLPDLGHIGKPDAIRPAAELGAKQLDLLGVYYHEHRLVGLEPLADEWGRALNELVESRIEECFVAERVLQPGGFGDRFHRTLLSSIVPGRRLGPNECTGSPLPTLPDASSLPTQITSADKPDMR